MQNYIRGVPKKGTGFEKSHFYCDISQQKWWYPTYKSYKTNCLFIWVKTEILLSLFCSNLILQSYAFYPKFRLKATVFFIVCNVFLLLPILTFCSIIAGFALSLYLNYWWDNIERILGQYWEDIGTILGEYWENIGRSGCHIYALV